MTEIWCRSVPKTTASLFKKEIAPVCLSELNASEVVIFPRSKLVIIDKCMLFSCRIVYQMYPTLRRGDDVLAATTHVGLNRDEEGDLEIFLTTARQEAFSFETNETQPFGIWADLIPVKMKSVLSIQKIGRKYIFQRRLVYLAWAMVGHQRSNANGWLRELSNNTDLMRIISWKNDISSTVRCPIQMTM